MKQTNNAIKFLMAQYRAVFKSAYLKGLATAVVLTSSLAVSSTASAVYINTDGTEWASGDYTESTTGSVAGIYDSGDAGNAASVSGGNLNVIYDLKKGSGTGDAFGGFANNTATGEAAATSNTITVSANVEGKVFGGGADSTGNTAASLNKVNISKGTIGGNVYGGRALSNTSAGATVTSTANENTVTIGADAKLNGAVFGGFAQGVIALNADKNTVSITGGSNNMTAVVMGGIAWAANASGAANTKINAAENQATLDSIKYSGSGSADSNYSGSLQYFGGLAKENETTGLSGATATSSKNQLSLAKSEISFSGAAASSSLKIAGNQAETNTANAVALGDSTAVSLNISESKISFTGSGDNIIAGGYANSISGGNATASANTAVINKSTLNSVNVYGGNAASSSGTATVSDNTLHITGTEFVTKSGAEKNAIIGAQVSGQTEATATGNKVVVDADSTVTGNIYGVNVLAGTKASASKNSVEFSGTIKGDIYGVLAKTSGSYTDNNVTVHGEHAGSKDAKFQIIGAYVDAAGASTLSGNKVIIASDATVTNANIMAAIVKGSTGSATNSGNIVQVDGTVIDSDILGTSGSTGGLIVSESGLIKVTSGGTSNLRSDIATIDGKVNVAEDGILNLTGFTKNGTDTDTSFNEGTFTLNGQLINDGTINIESGSKLSVGQTADYHNNATINLKNNSAAEFDVGALNGTTSTAVVGDKTYTTISGEYDVIGTISGTGSIVLKSQAVAYDTAGMTSAVVDADDIDSLNQVHHEIQSVRLNVGSDLDLTTASFSAAPAANKLTFQATGPGSYLTSDNIKYTATAGGENLQGVNLFAHGTLTFAPTAADAAEVVVSGAGFTGSFGGNRITTSNNTALKLQGGVELKMHNIDNAANQTGSIDVDLSLDGTNTTLSVLDMAVTAQNLTLTGNSGLNLINTDAAFTTALTAKKIDVGADSSVNLNSDTTLTANSLLNAGTVSGDKANINIMGDGSGDTIDLTGGSSISLTAGTLNLNKADDTVGLKLNAGTWSTGLGYSRVKTNGTTIKVDLSNFTGIDIDAANGLLALLADGTGIVDIGSTSVNLPSADKNGELSADLIDDANGNIILNFENDDTKKIVITNLSGTIIGGWQGVVTASDNADVNVGVGGQLSLYGTARDENIVADKSGKLTGITINDNGVLKLSTTGKVGDINGANGSVLLLDSNSNVTVGENGKVDVDTLRTTGGTLNATNINAVNTDLGVGTVISTRNLKVDQNSSPAQKNSFYAEGAVLNIAETLDLSRLDPAVTAQFVASRVYAQDIKAKNVKLSFTDTELKTTNFTVGSADIAGGKVAADVLKADTLNINKEGLIEADRLTLNSNAGIIQVGSDLEDNSSSGYLQVQNMKLAGGTLIVDPDYKQHTALVSVDQFGSVTGSATDVGVVDGNLFVGQNSALGLGLTSIAELKDIVSAYQTNGALNSDNYGAILYVDGATTIDAGHGIALTRQSLAAFDEYMTGSSNLIGGYSAKSHTIANAVYLGKNTALMVNSKVLSSDQGLITLTGDGKNEVKTRLVADGGEILIGGNVRARTIDLFDTADQDGMEIITLAGKNAAADGAYITVTTENNLLRGTLVNNLANGTATDGKVDMGVNKAGADSILSQASAPVFESLIAYAQGYHGDKLEDGSDESASAQGKADPAEPEYKPAANELYAVVNGKKTSDYHNYFLMEEVSRGNGASAETAARLGVYGGSVQAALNVGSSTYEAISGRFGLGVQNSGMSFADNGQGAGLWLAPVYKSSDSDGFAAEGVNYGTDVSLYGVALGGDYTLANGLCIGAMFNVGSGDADGKDAGATVTNDFDYFGLGIFAGYTRDSFSVVADLSYTNVDNEVTANTAIDQIGAKFDTSALSLGVTAQYALKLNEVELTPHAGLRFTRIDMDDYVVDGEDEIANYNADSMNIFSVPVGITLAREFAGESWTVKPSFDLTLTGNFGDDEIDGTVDWKGVENLDTAVSTEVLDNFTYGATIGVAAKTGNFSLGLGLNYTGSSNTDEFGVNANARYVF